MHDDPLTAKTATEGALKDALQRWEKYAHYVLDLKMAAPLWNCILFSSALEATKAILGGRTDSVHWTDLEKEVKRLRAENSTLQRRLNRLIYVSRQKGVFLDRETLDVKETKR